MRMRRGVVAAVCLVVVIATALAPLGAAAFCDGLVELPLLFGVVTFAPLPDVPAPRISSVLDAAPLVLRGPPAA